jgi:phospholipid/cholesterol/gamma-HCH transport system permease protein
MNRPAVALETAPDGARVAVPRGVWNLALLGAQAAALQRQIEEVGREHGLAWDLTRIAGLDSAGALLLWRGWGRRLPATLALTAAQTRLFDQIVEAQRRGELQRVPRSPFDWLIAQGERSIGVGRHMVDFTALIGQLTLDLAHLARHPGDIPWREISANLYKGGVLAMPVVALVGFLIGVVISYLSALQLRNVGADIFIVNILGVGILRELGPVLVAVLVAGRSGSAMTAQLGVMRVTEEIDALATMGVSRTLRLVLPKVVALAIAMPLLTLWTNASALIGGMVAASVQLDIGYGFFVEQLPKVVPIGNLYIGLVKGFAFGIIVAVVASYYGLRVRPNTESLSANTTSSVVTAITAVILADAVFAMATREIGLLR